MITCAVRRYSATLSILFGVALLFGTGPAASQSSPSLEKDLQSCLEVSNPQARLACFEALARGADGSARERDAATPRPVPSPPERTTPSESPESAPVRSSDTADSARPRQDRFGLPEKSEPKTEEETRRAMILAEARPLPRDKGLYIMDNGQVWTLVSGSFRPVEAGARVVIEEGLFGSYRMQIDGWSYRVRRVR